MPSAAPSWPTRPLTKKGCLCGRASIEPGPTKAPSSVISAITIAIDLEGVDLVVGVLARLAVLDDEDAHDLAEALDRHAEEAREQLLAGLGQVAEAAGVRGVAGVDRLGALGDLADEPLADAQARVVDRLGVEAHRRHQLEPLVVAAQVDRADLGDEALGDEANDAVKPLLAAAGLGERRAQARQQDTAVDRIGEGHWVPEIPDVVQLAFSSSNASWSA